jgi:hypothetical protein
MTINKLVFLEGVWGVGGWGAQQTTQTKKKKKKQNIIEKYKKLI